MLCLPEEGDHQGVLELGVGSRVEAVHTAEALAGRPAAQHLHVSLLRQLLAAGVGHLPGHDQLQQDVAVLCEHRGPRVVEPECLGRRVPHLDGPKCLRDAWVGDTRTQRCHELPRKRLSSRNCDQGHIGLPDTACLVQFLTGCVERPPPSPPAPERTCLVEAFRQSPTARKHVQGPQLRQFDFCLQFTWLTSLRFRPVFSCRRWAPSQSRVLMGSPQSPW